VLKRGKEEARRAAPAKQSVK
jgi:hypothetical protein